MAWVKVDDGFFNNQKIVSVSKDAKLIYLAALCHAGSTLSDGFIPKNAVVILAAQCDVRAAGKAVNELVSARLWIPTDSGYTIHDYLEHNTSSQEVQAQRDAARERAKRNRSQNVRANKQRSSPEVRENFASQKEEVETETELTTSSDVVGGANAPAKPKAKRASQIPSNWSVSDGLRKWAHENSFTDQDLAQEAPKFVDFWLSKGEPRKDWDAGFRTWMRNAKSYGHLLARPTRSTPQKSSGTIRTVDELFSQGADDEPTGHSENSRDSATRMAADWTGQSSDSGMDAGAGRHGLRVIASGSG